MNSLVRITRRRRRVSPNPISTFAINEKGLNKQFLPRRFDQCRMPEEKDYSRDFPRNLRRFSELIRKVSSIRHCFEGGVQLKVAVDHRSFSSPVFSMR